MPVCNRCVLMARITNPRQHELLFRHSREGGNPLFDNGKLHNSQWIPAFAGMTKTTIPRFLRFLLVSPASSVSPASPIILNSQFSINSTLPLTPYKGQFFVG